MDIPRSIFRVVTWRNNVRESNILDTTESMFTGNETDHFFLGETLTSERCNVRVESVLGLRDTWWASLSRINSPTPEVDLWTTASKKIS